MLISPKLYVSDKIAKKKDKIIAKISKGELVTGVFIITEATNGVDLFDIYNYPVTVQRYYSIYQNLTIYGIAKDLEDAYELIKKITDDCYKETNGADLRSFMAINKDGGN
ncbi:MAG: hypothetical protein K5656_01135 [Lachnospiraceae bacterium]|nr:hypothetical protein [Lachnospiraceae bacterium]